VIFVLGGFWLHPLTFVLAGLVILAGTQYEYLIMIRNTGVKPQLVPGMITGTASYLLATLIAAGILPVKFFLVLIPVMLFIMIVELYRRQEKPFDSLAHTFFSVLYTGIPLSMFPFAAFSRSGLDSILPHRLEMFSPGIIIGFFLLIWANDTGAYLAGVSFGKHKLFERISPKKTWEGFFGGVLLVVIVAWLLSSWLGVVGRTQWIIIALIVSVAGTYGDLIESMLKRSLGVKDSGNIMPGHGGFLDRFDSAIISFPLVYLFIALFG